MADAQPPVDQLVQAEVWCWPYDSRHRRWCDFPGHAALMLDEMIYDFHPDTEGPPASLQAPASKGLVLVRPEAEVAGETAIDFDVCCQCLDGRLMFDRTTGLFSQSEDGFLPSLFAYRIHPSDPQAEALRSRLAEFQTTPPSYHALHNNCTHFVRRVLLEAGIPRLQGDSWDPSGSNPGQWRPDDFNTLLASGLPGSRRLHLGWRVVPRDKAGRGHSYIWKEQPL
jgi:hypothetical protein